VYHFHEAAAVGVLFETTTKELEQSEEENVHSDSLCTKRNDCSSEVERSVRDVVTGVN
jgi:hypothetical protein